jgi:hypothetical protein
MWSILVFIFFPQSTLAEPAVGIDAPARQDSPARTPGAMNGKGRVILLQKSLKGKRPWVPQSGDRFSESWAFVANMV